MAQMLKSCSGSYGVIATSLALYFLAGRFKALRQLVPRMPIPSMSRTVKITYIVMVDVFMVNLGTYTIHGFQCVVICLSFFCGTFEESTDIFGGSFFVFGQK